jgi:uncharacterized lipoprotein YddW (UPF0748 family)
MQRLLFSRAGVSVRRLTWVAGLTVLLAGVPARADEFRGFWVDAWGAGFHSQAEVETLLGRVGSSTIIGNVREANCNAVVVQVRRRADVCYPSAMGEPYMSGLSPSNFNALQAMIDAAHDTTGGKQRIEVHCWIVVFKTRSDAPLYLAHDDPGDPDNYWITRYDGGAEPSDKPLDPGHPRASEYLTDVCMDLVNNFDIDGLHYDYIRFAANTEGYNPTSVARYNTRYGLSGQPPASSEQFKQWRRDQVTQYVRRVYAHVLRDRPEVKVTAALVTWNPSPVSSTRAAFMNTRPYYDVFCDWDAWMEEGILDMSIPMTYYNQASLPNDFQRWMDFQKDRQFNRQNVVGPGIYLNSLSNAILQLQMTRSASPAGNYSEGFCGYSYRVPYSGGTWSGFESSLISQVTPSPDSIPDMPWKTSPTVGHAMGTVTYFDTGEWADGASVDITGPVNRTMTCDGTGFYAFIDLPPGSYTVTAGAPGYPDATSSVSVAAGIMSEQDLELGGTTGPEITSVQATGITSDSVTITWNTSTPADSRVEYGTTLAYGSTSPLDATLVTSHSIGLSGLATGTLYHYRAISADGGGTTYSTDNTFTTAGPPAITNVQVTGITDTTATITWDTSAPADSQVEYGTTVAYGNTTPLDPTLMMSHSVTLTNLDPLTPYHCRVHSANSGGASVSDDEVFTTLDFIEEIVIDNTDPGWANTSPGGNAWSVGSSSVVPKIGENYLYTSGVGNTDESAATRKCTWTPNLPREGLWDVYVYYQIGSNRSAGAPFKVVYDGGEVVSLENQYSETPNQGGWFLIGPDLPFLAGTEGYVQCSNNSTDTALVSADAARFVYKGSSDTTPPTIPVVTDDGTYAPSQTELHASWTTSDPETGIAGCEYRILEPGGPIVRNWTSVGVSQEVNAVGLTLGLGKTYVFEVRATNGAGLVSGVGTSDGITIFGFDVNGDGHVKSDDMSFCLACLSGAGVPYPGDTGVDCGRFDTDGDTDVDMSDIGVFQRCLTGGDPIDLGCLEE